MNFLLDTNACIALINADNPRVQGRFEQAVRMGGTVHLSSVVLFELWFGVWKSSKQAWNLQRLTSFVAGPVNQLPFEAMDSQVAGRIRADLRAIGKPVGDYDLLIAAQARSRGMVLVTHNVREFSRVSGLVVDDWES